MVAKFISNAHNLKHGLSCLELFKLYRIKNTECRRIIYKINGLHSMYSVQC